MRLTKRVMTSRERERARHAVITLYALSLAALSLAFGTLTDTLKTVAIHTHTCKSNAAVAVTYLFLQKSNNNLITFLSQSARALSA